MIHDVAFGDKFRMSTDRFYLDSRGGETGKRRFRKLENISASRRLMRSRSFDGKQPAECRND
jgi:hypothetical protein